MKKARFKRAFQHTQQTANRQLRVPTEYWSIDELASQYSITVIQESRPGLLTRPDRSTADHVVLARTPGIDLQR